MYKLNSVRIEEEECSQEHHIYCETWVQNEERMNGNMCCKILIQKPPFSKLEASGMLKREELAHMMSA